MAKHTDGLTNAERKDLETLGYIEGNPLTIPENISPVLKAKIQEAYAKDKGIENAIDLPTATERQNAAVRERAAADGNEAMQKVTGVGEGTVDTKRQTDVNK